MPDALELPGVLRPVVPLMSGERFAGFGRSVVNELVALCLGRAGRLCGFTGWRSRLVPGLAAVVGALNDLPKPAAALRSINAIGIGRGSLNVIQLPARKVRPADL